MSIQHHKNSFLNQKFKILTMKNAFKLFEEFKIDNEIYVKGGMRIDYYRSHQQPNGSDPGPVTDDIGFSFDNGGTFTGRDYYREHSLVVPWDGEPEPGNPLFDATNTFIRAEEIL
jgi:hypothetical protein